jgi:hypothetical protein
MRHPASRTFDQLRRRPIAARPARPAIRSAAVVGSINGGLGPRLVPVSRCDAAKGVKLEAWISADCATLTGRIRARAPALDVEFTAAAE